MNITINWQKGILAARLLMNSATGVLKRLKIHIPQYNANEGGERNEVRIQTNRHKCPAV